MKWCPGGKHNCRPDSRTSYCPSSLRCHSESVSFISNSKQSSVNHKPHLEFCPSQRSDNLQRKPSLLHSFSFNVTRRMALQWPLCGDKLPPEENIDFHVSSFWSEAVITRNIVVINLVWPKKVQEKHMNINLNVALVTSPGSANSYSGLIVC